MKRVLLIILIFSLWAALPAAAKPVYQGRGVVKIKGKTQAEAREQALQEALSDLAGQVYSQVKSSVRLREVESDTYSSSYLKQVQVESCVELCGYDVSKDAAEKGRYYVEISVSRSRLQNHYQNLINLGIDETIAAFEGAQRLLDMHHGKEALNALKQLRGQLIDLANYRQVFSSLYDGDIAQALPNLALAPRLGEIDALVAELQGNPLQSYSDLAEDLISQFPPALQEPHTFQLSYLEWLNTGFSSEFGVAFSEYLAGELQRRFGWQKVQQPYRPQLNLSGQLLPEGERINLHIRLFGTSQLSSHTQLSPKTVAYLGEDNIKPKKLGLALSNQEFMQNEAVQSGFLKVDIRFNPFQKDNPVYRLGDDVRLYIKANKACYLSIINVEADGAWNVVEQNYRVAAEDAGDWVPILQTFKVAPPVGIEQLMVQASLQELPYYHIQKEILEDGWSKNISTGLLKEIAQTRSIQVNKPSSNEYTEAYLSWTVLER